MTKGNPKRALNRLSAVLTVLWLFYCIIVFPRLQIKKAWDHYGADVTTCNAITEPEPRLPDVPPAQTEECLSRARKEYQQSVNLWSGKMPFGARDWRLVLLVIALALGPPLVAYGLLRSVATVGLWILHGYKEPRR